MTVSVVASRRQALPVRVYIYANQVTAFTTGKSKLYWLIYKTSFEVPYTALWYGRSTEPGARIMVMIVGAHHDPGSSWPQKSYAAHTGYSRP